MISIIVISHNYGKFLNRCVNSILKNDKSFIKEIIIINDSAQTILIKLPTHLKRNKFIKYFKRNFRSLSKSSNFGISKARGKWVTKIDADDLILKNFLKNVASFILKNKKTDLILGNIIEKDIVKNKKKVIKQDFLNKSNIFNYPHGSGIVFKKDL